MKRLPLCGVLLLLILMTCSYSEELRELPYKESYETKEFSIKFLPEYPLVIGEKTRINLATPLIAEEVVIQLPDGKKIFLVRQNGDWVGEFLVSEDFGEGWRPLYIIMKHRSQAGDRPIVEQFLEFLRFRTEVKYKSEILSRRIWVRAFKPVPPTQPTIGIIRKMPLIPPEEFPGTFEALIPPPPPTAEVATREAIPLLIKGTRLFSFSSRSIEGTKEGYIPGINREESLRINVSGVVQETEVDANFFSTSTIGTTTVASQEQHISILLRRGSMEAYFGDLTADLTDVEFARYNDTVSGIKLSGDFNTWGFKAIASTPQGQPRVYKAYGNGTQGPYNLGASPVVIDSERVYLDGIPQKRGNDYDIDYQAGTVTFRNQTILNTSIIEVYYDYRETLYGHSTYALRGYATPNPNLKIGATYIDDSDSLKDAASIFQNQTSSTIEPQSHYVVGADGTLMLSDLLLAQGEVAYSEKKTNLLTDPNLAEIGKAARLETVSQLGPVGLNLKFKRIGPKFEPVADALPKQDLWEYLGLLTYRPNSLLMSSVNYGSESFTQAGTDFKNKTFNGKVRLTPEKLPTLEYLLDEFTESNDPVPPYSSFDRLTVRNTYSAVHTMGKLNLSASAQDERRIVRSPSQEVTEYKIGNVGLSTSGLENLTSSLNLQLKDTIGPAGDLTVSKNYIFNLSASPAREYMAAVSLNYTEDTKDGITNVTDLSLRAEPVKAIRMDAKYTTTSVKETFGASEEAVLKYAGSLKLEFRPHPALRARYYLKPNFTTVSRTGDPSYNNQSQQYDINLFLSSNAMLGATHTLGQSFSVDKSDYPNYLRKDSFGDSKSTIYSLKVAPFRFLSCEFNLQNTDDVTNQLQSPATLETYSKGRSLTDKFEAIVKTSLTERVAVDTSYVYNLSRQGSGEAVDNYGHVKSHTGSAKLIFNVNPALTLNASYAYTLSTNLLATSNAETYTQSPGAGFIYRYGDNFRMDGEYSYSRSYAGSQNEKHLYTLRAKYDVFEFLHFTTSLQKEVSIQPDYATTDFYGNIEINL